MLYKIRKQSLLKYLSECIYNFRIRKISIIVNPKMHIWLKEAWEGAASKRQLGQSIQLIMSKISGPHNIFRFCLQFQIKKNRKIAYAYSISTCPQLQSCTTHFLAFYSLSSFFFLRSNLLELFKVIILDDKILPFKYLI